MAEDSYQHFINNELIHIDENKTHIFIEINKTTTNDLNIWLDTLCKLIDYDNHQVLYAQHDGSILHLYLPVMSASDQVEMTFCARHLRLFERLTTVIDVDDGVLFEY